MPSMTIHCPHCGHTQESWKQLCEFCTHSVVQTSPQERERQHEISINRIEHEYEQAESERH